MMNQVHPDPDRKVYDVRSVLRERKKLFPLIMPAANVAGDHGLDFLQLLLNLEASMPPHPQITHALSTWLMRLLHGEECTIFTLTCPDWSWMPNPDPTGMKYVYTFTELWDGVGITAERALNRLPELWAYLKQLKTVNGKPMRLKFVVSVANNEGDSPDVLARLGISHDEFNARCIRSLQKLESAMLERAPDMPIITQAVTNAAGGCWDEVLSHAHEIMERGEHFGRLIMHDDPDWQQKKWDRIVRLRRNIYSRMNPGMDPSDVLRMQGAEYVAAALLSDRFPNCFQFAVDNDAMDLFAQGGGRDPRPAVCMIANYT